MAAAYWRSEIADEHDMQMITRILDDKIERKKDKPLDVALVGEGGTGKTSFINAVRGLDSNDPEYVDVLEPAQYLKSYTQNNVRFWDYLESKDLNAESFENYDIFLIFSCGRVSEANIRDAVMIHQSEKPFFFIRTMIDQDLENSRRSHPKTHNDEMMLKRIRSDAEYQLSRANVHDADIFLISNFETTSYDFPELKRKLMSSSNVQCYKSRSLAISLRWFCADGITNMAESLPEDISKVSWSALWWCLVPLPGYFMNSTKGLLINEIGNYKRKLGIDDNSITTALRWAGIQFTSLDEETRTSLSFQNPNDWVDYMINRKSNLRYLEYLRFLPVLGTLPACWYARAETVSLLSDAVKILKKDAISMYTSVVTSKVNQRREASLSAGQRM